MVQMAWSLEECDRHRRVAAVEGTGAIAAPAKSCGGEATQSLYITVRVAYIPPKERSMARMWREIRRTVLLQREGQGCQSYMHWLIVWIHIRCRSPPTGRYRDQVSTATTCTQDDFRQMHQAVHRRSDFNGV